MKKLLQLISLVLLGIGLFVPNMSAAVENAPNGPCLLRVGTTNYGTVQEAIQAVPPGGLVKVAADAVCTTFPAGGIPITKNVKIEGGYRPNWRDKVSHTLSVFDAGNAGRHLNIQGTMSEEVYVTIENINLRRGNAVAGGAISGFYTNLNLVNVHLTENTASAYGGAVHAQNSDLKIRGLNAQLNNAPEGSVFYVQAAPVAPNGDTYRDLELKNAFIVNNGGNSNVLVEYGRVYSHNTVIGRATRALVLKNSFGEVVNSTIAYNNTAISLEGTNLAMNEPFYVQVRRSIIAYNTTAFMGKNFARILTDNVLFFPIEQGVTLEGGAQVDRQNETRAEPGFINGSGNNFDLGPNSPACRKYNTYFPHEKDILERPRQPKGSLGAFEGQEEGCDYYDVFFPYLGKDF